MGPRNRVILALAVAAHVAIVASVILQARPVIWPLHNDTIHRRGPGADFYAVYHAAVNVRDGVSPYEDNDDGVTPFFYPFRYLPIVALAARPLLLMPPHAAHVLWMIVLEALLASVIVGLRRHVERPLLWLIAAVALLLSSPYFLEMYMGQFTFATVALCALALTLPAGWATFALSAVLKPFTLVAVPALLRRRYWRHAGAAVAAVMVLSLPYFLRHPGDWSRFSDANFGLKGGMGSYNYGFVMLLRLVTEDLGISMLPGTWESAIGAFRWFVLAIAALLVVTSKRKGVVLGACALLLAHFVTYQHVWEHHMSAVLVIGALLLGVKSENRWFLATVLVSMVLLALPTPYAVFDVAKSPRVWDPAVSWPRAASYLVLLPKVVPTVALLVVAVIELSTAGFGMPRFKLPAGRARLFL